ncbi:hypothetical protein CDB3_00680 [Bacillus sp. CDB3]|nr:hypothetical protein CDB3_00680 [Bacillus sp. CDB3]
MARYYSKKKNIYKIENNNSKLLPQYVKEYLNSITVPYKDIELWHTWLDEYELENVEYEKTNVSKLTVNKLERFFSNYTYINPKIMVIIRNRCVKKLL